MLISLIVNNINNSIHYGKTNIIVNTCKPMQNWRQYNRNSAVRSYKYTICDESVSIDLIKLNQFLDKMFVQLPKLKVNNFDKDILNSNILNNIDIYKNNVKYIEFNELDIWDAYNLLNGYFKYTANLTFDKLNYNIISDGNHEYNHDSNFPDELKENIRLQLIDKGII